MKKRRKAKHKHLSLALILIVSAAIISLIVGAIIWAVRDSGVKRQSAMNKEIDRIALPGKTLTRTYTDAGCSTGQTFGFGIRTCNTYIHEAFPSTGIFCADFNAFDLALKKAGYQYMDHYDPSRDPTLIQEDIISKYGENPANCNYFRELSSGERGKFIVYALGTTYSTTDNFSVYCEIGEEAHLYNLEDELNLPRQNIATRSKTYGCILHHN